MKIENFISELDTCRFGLKIAKVDDFGENPYEILNFIKDEGVKLVISKINSNNLKTINLLEDYGFRIKDNQVTYTYLLKNFNQNLASVFDTKTIIRKFNSSDMHEIRTMLGETFNNYGHYFADEMLEKSKSLEVYIDWGTRSCLDNDVADVVFVAQVGNELTGFLSFKKFRNEQKTYAAGGLGAVYSKFRGRNIFKMLAVKGLLWGIEENLDWVEHNVLTNNFPVNRAFSSTGFYISNSFITMHCWL